MSDILQECVCPFKFTIEPHGDGHVLFYGRCNHRHGYNLCAVTEVSHNCLDIINGTAPECQTNPNVLDRGRWFVDIQTAAHKVIKANRDKLMTDEALARLIATELTKAEY